MNLKLLICGLLLYVNTPAAAQAINNTKAYRNINSSSYIRLNYENDLFAHTDRYYTQGINLEIVHPALAHFPLSRLLIHDRAATERYGLALQHNVYTPTDISVDTILYKDHPYAASLMLQSFVIGTNTQLRIRYSTILTIGIIGPAAGGAEMQTAIHRAINDKLPQGWPNQIQNDIALNYELNVERLIFNSRDVFMAGIGVRSNNGTLSNTALLTGTFMFGNINNPYRPPSGHTSALYIYAHPEAGISTYEAAMRGGLFNKNSPYKLQRSETENFIARCTFGICANVRRTTLEYYYTIGTRTFKAGMPHAYGGLQIAVSL